jgi:molybdate transport system substrate-binding protein
VSRLARLIFWPYLAALLVGCAAAPVTAPSPTVAAVESPAGPSVELTVFAAASLIDSFTAIGQKFEAANPGTKVTFNFAGSNELAAQIGKGAPADVFASANLAQLNGLVKSGQIAEGSSRTFARNRLVVIVPVTNPAKLTTLADLARPGLKLVLADKSVPVGQYALDFLDKASADPSFGSTYKANVLTNVVSYEQDVKAVVSKISLGEGDAGVVYATDVTPAVADKLGKIAIPDALNTVATYPIGPIKGSKQPALAQKFVEFLLSADGQAILAQWGFLPPT